MLASAYFFALVPLGDLGVSVGVRGDEEGLRTRSRGETLGVDPRLKPSRRKAGGAPAVEAAPAWAGGCRRLVPLPLRRRRAAESFSFRWTTAESQICAQCILMKMAE